MKTAKTPADIPASMDPEDWDALRERAHDMLDRSIDHMMASKEGRVWTPVPEALKSSLQEPLFADGVSARQVDHQIEALLPHGPGNKHPRFFGWVHGSGTPSGIIADMAAAALNANAGGRDHVALYVEQQLVSWVRTLFGFPETASGLVVSGTSTATLIALKAARDAALDFVSRSGGIDGAGLVAYTSSETHSCVARTFDILGLGSAALRRLPVDGNFRMSLDALKGTIEEDRSAGLTPFAIIGTAGTVNTGAIDPLPQLAALSKANGLWFHIDAAFGASGVLSDTLRPRLSGMELADSIAFDFHKWMHVNYDAGFVLVRDEELHRRAFSDRPDYLASNERGLAAGYPWPVDYGIELSRGFKALKVWAHLMEHGTDKLGRAVSRNCEQVSYLADKIDAHPQLQRLAPVETSVCCLRFVPRANVRSDELDRINQGIAIRLQESGVAAPSTTRINGNLAIRVNITNHRTEFSDLDLLVDAIVEQGEAISNES